MNIKHLENSSLEIVFKVQETCNINCTYCYMYNVGNAAFELVPETQANEDTWDKVADFIIRENRTRKPSSTRLVFHGGEPMLIKYSTFERRMVRLRERIDAGLGAGSFETIKFAIQTNATMVSKEWKEVLIKWNICVGVSVDGPQAIHDKRRVDKRGRGTYERVAAGIALLSSEPDVAKNGFGALCVIDHQADGAEVYRHFVDHFGFTGFNFLLPFMNWDTFDREVVNGVSNFLLAAFREWCRDIERGKVVSVRIFFEVLGSLQRLNKPTCMDNLNIGHDVVVVECDGTIMAEESLRPTYIGFFSNLKVGECTVDEIRNAPQFIQMKKDTHTIAQDCHGCALLSSCRSGSALGRVGMRYSASDSTLRKSVYCETFIELYVQAAAFLEVNGASFLNTRAGNLESHG